MNDNPFGSIAKADIFEGDGAFDHCWLDSINRIRRLFFSIQEIENALGGSGSGLEHVGNVSHLHDGLGKRPHVLDESQNVADANRALHGKETAEDDNGDVGNVADESHDGHQHTGEELGLPAGAV